MTSAPTRYDSIAQLWSTVKVPALTRREAERAAARIFRHFGAVKLGGPRMVYPARFDGHARRCWISPRGGGGSDKGWQRLVHDVSHDIFAHRHPKFRPHAGGHATLELEIAEFVVQSGWLSGTLKPRPAIQPTARERRATKIARTEAAIARWEGKRRRAEKALKKMRRRYRALIRSSPSDPQQVGPQSSANASPSSTRPPQRGRSVSDAVPLSTSQSPSGIRHASAGLQWQFAEMPPDLAYRRPDVPRSAHRYGVIATSRPLTSEELERFELDIAQ